MNKRKGRLRGRPFLLAGLQAPVDYAFIFNEGDGYDKYPAKGIAALAVLPYFYTLVC